MKTDHRIIALVLTLALLSSAFAMLGASAKAPEISVVNASANETTTYNFLINDMGLNVAAACGVLANIYCESNFNPNALGDNGTSYGICQWHLSRWDRLKEYCGNNGYDWTTLVGQLHYLHYELVNYYKTRVWDKITAVPNTADGAYTAGYTWCYNFEVPADTENVAKYRGNLAKNTYWPRYAQEDTCDCSDSYAGYYICTTSEGYPLRIRAGHGTDFDKIGEIPSGAVCYVSKANGIWAHVTYNDVSGYASMEYLRRAATYTITYNANGGADAPEPQEKIEKMSVYLSTATPNRQWYDFKGWATSADATSAEYQPYAIYSTDADLTLYAVWAATEKTLSSVAVESMPDKTVYQIGEAFDPKGLSVRLNYADGTSFVINEGFGISGFDSSSAGTKTVTVTYQDKTATFSVTVGSDGPTDECSCSDSYAGYYICQTSSGVPLRIRAGHGTEFDKIGEIPSGAVVYVTMGDGSWAHVTYNGVSGYASMDYLRRAETYAITYNANGGTGAPEAQEKIEKLPINLSETVPERKGFVFAGWALRSDVAEPLYQPGDEYAEDMALDLYAVWNAAAEPELAGIAVETLPEKTVYKIDEYLRPAGLTIRLVYSDESYEIIRSGFTLSELDSSSAGVKTVYVYYKGFSASFEVTVEPSFAPGDVNGDTNIDATDYLMVKRSVLGTYDLTDGQRSAADVSANGEVDTADYLMIKRHVLGSYTIEN